MVDVFGHRRYAYSFGDHGDVLIDIAHVNDVVRPCMVIIDTYRFGIDFGKATRLYEINHDLNLRQMVRFFEVRGFKYTSSKV